MKIKIYEMREVDVNFPLYLKRTNQSTNWYVACLDENTGISTSTSGTTEANPKLYVGDDDFEPCSREDFIMAFYANINGLCLTLNLEIIGGAYVD